ncbi:MAG: hypothetical protein M3044_00030 [Thermoproteota archaeon]|nr:hypothetical protein [Thermoproteota archaeon]
MLRVIISKKISVPLHSRFFIVELESYTYKRFCEITKQLLLHHNVRRAGFKPKGIETEKDVEERKHFLRKIGYKM